MSILMSDLGDNKRKDCALTVRNLYVKVKPSRLCQLILCQLDTATVMLEITIFLGEKMPP